MKDPTITKAVADIKTELHASATELRALRDDVRAKVHLGTVDAKNEWSRLEPKLEAVLLRAGEEVTDAAHTAVVELTGAIRRLRDALR
jgi:hypothetical protein